MQTTIPIKLILLLAAVFAMTPFAINSYLPAVPLIATDMGVNTSTISITVSIYIFGMAIGQLIGGPLSDKVGRKKIMVAGLVIFAVFSLMLSATKSVELFWLWRVLQSIGGGIAVVGVSATIRDVAEGQQAAKLFSLIALIMMAAPSLAPSIGTLILNTLSWHWIFSLSGMLALAVAVAAVLIMPPQLKKTHKPKSIGFKGVFQHKQALGYLASVAFSYSVLITFITNAPFVYLINYGVSTTLFSSLFIANITGLIAINRLNSYLLNRFDPERLLPNFIKLQLIGTSVLIASQLFAPESLWFAVCGFVLSIAANGGIMANANASFMRHFGKNAGTASAALGATQFFVGASISAVAALLSQHSLWPMIIIMFSCALLSLFGAITANRRNHIHQSSAG
ncbi:bicyclomycin/multidrug efflux system [Psychromonas marina]|uniref:Bcr/CflA family efflux transporter n=1 Tax=Psychromonas marina TaxID=88364 RepID=A0ABQ6E4Z3_9GAMM|nr:multidrug effflux MFS transporter [Psychromonas marina]GLS92456.1 bicyclomycin/multidrug efflux system [Psychromonas marina]